MSMISSLIDELRKLADGQATYRDARAVMLEAADTIWQLRDDLQRANAAVQDAEHDESMAWDRVRKAEAENAKLQNDADLLREMLQAKRQDTHALMSENAKLRELIRDIDEVADPYLWGFIGQRKKELGIEVD